MGNLVGKYAEWEVNEEESKDGDETEGMVFEGSVEQVSVIMKTYIQASNDSTTNASPKAGDKRKRSESVEANGENKEDESATKKPKSPGTRGFYYYLIGFCV